MMMKLNTELVFLILQFCREEELNDTAHVLERETALFFDLDYFQSLILAGKWDEVEAYLSGFGALEENEYFKKVYFEVRKQKFFEALEMNDRAKALQILKMELQVFASYDKKLFEELTSDDFGELNLLEHFGNLHSTRSDLSNELREIIEADPGFQGKLEFPSIEMSRLRCLVNQSLNWQHTSCKNSKPNPVIETLFRDHICHPTTEQSDSSSLVKLNGRIWETMGGKTYSRSFDLSLAECSTGLGPDVPATAEISEVEDASETVSISMLQEEVWPCPSDDLESNHIDLPKPTGLVFNVNSSPTTMDFHPVDNSILLVGTDTGDLSIWDFLSRKKLVSKSFKIWDVGSCTTEFKTAFDKDPRVSVNCATYSTDGSLIGVAFSKHIVQLYVCCKVIDILPILEIDAHAGSVNDIMFTKPDNKTLVVTCGDDKMVKVWDAGTGTNNYIFKGHDAAVTCVCPREIKGVQFIFSSSANGELRGWTYDSLGYRIAFNDPRCRRMVCTKNGERVFSCGINDKEESCILEWHEHEGSVKRTYQGLRKPFPGIVHFDTARNQILAAGDDHCIKFWDMRNLELLSSLDAGNYLPVYPYIRFNKDGNFLAASATNNRILILATPHGQELEQSQNNFCDCRCKSIPADLKRPQVSSAGIRPLATRAHQQKVYQCSLGIGTT